MCLTLATHAAPICLDAPGAWSPREAIRDHSSDDGWELVKDDASPSGWRLQTAVTTEAPDLSLPLGVSGIFDIRIGVYMPDTLTSGVLVRLDNEPAFAFLRGHLDGNYPAYHEVLYKAAECTGRTLLVRQPAEYRSFVTHVMLAPRKTMPTLPPATKQVVGLDCTFHRYYFFSMREEGTSAVGVNMHALNGFTEEVFCCGRSVLTYESRVGTHHKVETRRPRTHWLNYHSSTHTPLQSALRAAERSGIELSTRLSMNCHYHGTYENALTSQFVLDNPRFHDKRRDGTVDNHRMCYGYEPVRQERLDIFRELVEMGSNHLFVDCRRYMPMTQWGDPYIRGFKQAHGVDPRTLEAGDPLWSTWLRWRADFFTRVLRDIQRTLTAMERDSVSVTLRVNAESPAANLAHGVDLETIVAERLVDRLVLGEKDSRALAPEYLALLRGTGIECLGCLGVHGAAMPGPEHHTKGNWPAAMYKTPDIDKLAAIVHGFYKAGFDGVAFYETDEATAMPRMRRFFIACRRPDTLETFIEERRQQRIRDLEQIYSGFRFQHAVTPVITSTVGPIDNRSAYAVAHAVDGDFTTHYIADRGCCRPGGPGCTITLDFPHEVSSRGIAMLTRCEGGEADWSPRKMTVEYKSAAGWQTVPGMPATNLKGPHVILRYEPLTTTGLRLHLEHVTGGAHNPDIIEMTWE